MTPSPIALFLAFVSFALTFALARLLRGWLKRRQARKDEEAVARNQTRQVRRARARKAGRR